MSKKIIDQDCDEKLKYKKRNEETNIYVHDRYYNEIIRPRWGRTRKRYVLSINIRCLRHQGYLIMSCWYPVHHFYKHEMPRASGRSAN
jgi:hypothetical protein